MIKAVRAHNLVVNLLKKENNGISASKQQANVLKDPESYSKCLLTPGLNGLPTFDKSTADTYFSKNNGATKSEITNISRPMLKEP